MLRDVVDLRKNKWVPRREENYNPKTIDQIHKEAKEAQMQRSQEQRNSNIPKDTAKPKKGKMHGFYNIFFYSCISFSAA